MRGLAGATLSLGLIAGAGELARAQDAGADDLARILTEQFLGIGAGLRPQPAPPAVPSPPPPASTPTPTSPPTLFGIPVTTPTPAPAPQAGAAPPAGQFLLAGVVITGDTGMALLQEPGQPGPRFVRLGESIGAYRLTAVRPDRVTLAGPAGDLVVVLGGGAVAMAGSPAPVAREPAVASFPAGPAPDQAGLAPTRGAIEERDQPKEERRRAKQERMRTRPERRAAAGLEP